MKMNERIKELAEQAGFQINPLKGLIHLPGLNPTANIQLEKFAELIVRECCDVLFDNELGGYQVNYVLKEHFGIKS